MKTIIYLMLVIVMIYSVSLFIFGKTVEYKLPKNMQSIFTYHSTISDKSYDMWLTAQRIFGRFCLKTSYVILPINIILSVLFLLFISKENIIILSFFVLIIFDLISLKVTRFKTEKELKNL